MADFFTDFSTGIPAGMVQWSPGHAPDRSTSSPWTADSGSAHLTVDQPIDTVHGAWYEGVLYRDYGTGNGTFEFDIVALNTTFGPQGIGHFRIDPGDNVDYHRSYWNLYTDGLYWTAANFGGSPRGPVDGLPQGPNFGVGDHVSIRMADNTLRITRNGVRWSQLGAPENAGVTKHGFGSFFAAARFTNLRWTDFHFQPPAVTAEVTPPTGAVSLTATLHVTARYPLPDDDIIVVNEVDPPKLWDIDFGDGTPHDTGDWSTAPPPYTPGDRHVSHTYGPGVFHPSVTVTDSKGLSTTVPFDTVTVTPPAPVEFPILASTRAVARLVPSIRKEP